MALLLHALLYLAAAAAAAAAAADIHYQHTNLFPESFDWDEQHSRFILGSMSTGSLHTLSQTGQLHPFAHLRPDNCPQCAVVGVRVDPHRNRVIAVVHNFDHSTPPFSAVAAYDLSTKTKLFLTPLIGKSDELWPVANDVTIDADGDLYVTNAAENFIWKINSDGSHADVFTDDLRLSSQPVRSDDELVKVCGLNGIVYHPDGYLLVGQSNSGALFKINLKGDQVNVVESKSPLVGADGIAMRGDGNVAVVSQSRAWLLRSTDHWRTVTVVDEVELDASAFATALRFRDGMKMYVLDSHLLKMKAGESWRDFSVRHVEFPKEDGDDPVWMLLLLVLAVVLVLGWRFQMAHFFNEYKRKRY